MSERLGLWVNAEATEFGKNDSRKDAKQARFGDNRKISFFAP